MLPKTSSGVLFSLQIIMIYCLEYSTNHLRHTTWHCCLFRMQLSEAQLGAVRSSALCTLTTTVDNTRGLLTFEAESIFSLK